MNNLTPHLNTTMQDIQLKKALRDQGFKEYGHKKSGFKAWSITNLCEYSDEWINLDNIPW